ncbi:hypothetical protein [Geodermatophilus sp. URMC 64]
MTRDRPVGALPAAGLRPAGKLLGASLDETAATTRRRFADAGAVSAEPDLAERSEDILRSDEDADAAGGRDDPSV